jgi:uncharacterized protein DUF6174
MRRVMLVSTTVALLAAIGCGGPLSPSKRSELERAKARWEAARIADYTVESRIRCFCPGHLVVWTRLTIRDNRVVDAQPLEPLPPGSFATVFGWQTVSGLFDRIESSSQSSYVKDIAVQYDPMLGYPQQIVLTCQSNVSDCDASYEMRALAR